MDSKQFKEEYNKIVLKIIEEKDLPLQDELIDEEESGKAVFRKYTPQEYFDYKMKLKNWPYHKGKGECLKFDD